MTITVVVGPTASGKTALAIDVAQRKKAAVISADSRQVYTGFNIGTAKPTQAWYSETHAASEPDTIENVPHFLINIRPPTQLLTLSEWQQAALTCVESLSQCNTPTLLVGGTMLYVDSVMYHYDVPAVAPRADLRAQLEQFTTAHLYTRLLAADPKAGHFVEAGNRRRIIRALEVIETTGKPFSAQRRMGKSPYAFVVVGIFPGWEHLEEHVALRTEAMWKAGLLEETRLLRERYTPQLSLLRTLNYRQAGAVLDGVLSPMAARDDMTRATMRYARRQMSWWKKNQAIRWFGSVRDAGTFLDTLPF